MGSIGSTTSSARLTALFRWDRRRVRLGLLMRGFLMRDWSRLRVTSRFSRSEDGRDRNLPSSVPLVSEPLFQFRMYRCFSAVILMKRVLVLAMTSPPISWIVMPPDLTASRHAEVIMAVDSTIFTCDNLEHIDQVRLPSYLLVRFSFLSFSNCRVVVHLRISLPLLMVVLSLS